MAEFLTGAGGTLAIRKTATVTVAGTPTATASTDGVLATLLDVIAEKTGYPVASLDETMSLDSDLGVDSIKRVEILAAVRERLPGAPEVKADHLGTLHTIRDVAEFLTGAAPVVAPATAKIPIVQITPPPPGVVDAAPTPNTALTPVVVFSDPNDLTAPDTEQVAEIQQQIAVGVAEKRVIGRGSDVARPPGSRAGVDNTIRAAVPLASDRIDRSILQAGDLDLSHARPRVPLARGGVIWIVSERDALAQALVESLVAQGFKPALHGWSDSKTAKMPPSLSGLVLLAPRVTDANFRLNRRAFAWLKLVGSKLRQTGRAGGAVFVTVARLDGAFGLANLAIESDPSQGGLAGLVKTARHEWPEVACKAIDLDPAFNTASNAAAALADEMLSVGPIEVGIARTHRCTLDLARTVRRQGPQLINLGSKDVILVTGGARGVTAETAVALAETYRPTLVLTGRTPTPGPEPEWLAGLATEAELKQAITNHLGSSAGPRQIGEQYQLVVREREIRRNMERIVAVGSKVAYFPVNITNEKAVADLLQQTRVKFGPVTAIVHGAGVLADKRLEDLTPDQFDHVYATKVDGLQNLLELLTNEELKARPLQFDHRSVWEARPSCLCLRERGVEQDRAAGIAASAGMPGCLHQLGTVGRRHGHSGIAESIRERGSGRHSAPRWCSLHGPGIERRGSSDRGGRDAQAARRVLVRSRCRWDWQAAPPRPLVLRRPGRAWWPTRNPLISRSHSSGLSISSRIRY